MTTIRRESVTYLQRLSACIGAFALGWSMTVLACVLACNGRPAQPRTCAEVQMQAYLRCEDHSNEHEQCREWAKSVAATCMAESEQDGRRCQPQDGSVLALAEANQCERRMQEGESP